MSAFYGTIEGQRGPATRCGSLSSGIKAAAQSWDGSVVVNLRYQERFDSGSPLMVEIRTSNDSSAYGAAAWEGTFDEFKEMLAHDNERKRDNRFAFNL